MTQTAQETFYIASLKHTNKRHEHITWWGKDHRGYTPVVGASIGEYVPEEAASLNDGVDYIAVPVAAVRTLLSPEPYYRQHAPARFYDQDGPVVDNSRSNWNRLIELSMKREGSTKPKPETHRGTRHAFAVELAPPAKQLLPG